MKKPFFESYFLPQIDIICSKGAIDYLNTFGISFVSFSTSLSLHDKLSNNGLKTVSITKETFFNQNDNIEPKIEKIKPKNDEIGQKNGKMAKICQKSDEISNNSPDEMAFKCALKEFFKNREKELQFFETPWFSEYKKCLLNLIRTQNNSVFQFIKPFAKVKLITLNDIFPIINRISDKNKLFDEKDYFLKLFVVITDEKQFKREISKIEKIFDSGDKNNLFKIIIVQEKKKTNDKKFEKELIALLSFVRNKISLLLPQLKISLKENKSPETKPTFYDYFIIPSINNLPIKTILKIASICLSLEQYNEAFKTLEMALNNEKNDLKYDKKEKTEQNNIKNDQNNTKNDQNNTKNDQNNKNRSKKDLIKKDFCDNKNLLGEIFILLATTACLGNISLRKVEFYFFKAISIFNSEKKDKTRSILINIFIIEIIKISPAYVVPLNNFLNYDSSNSLITAMILEQKAILFKNFVYNGAKRFQRSFANFITLSGFVYQKQEHLLFKKHALNCFKTAFKIFKDKNWPEIDNFLLKYLTELYKNLVPLQNQKSEYFLNLLNLKKARKKNQARIFKLLKKLPFKEKEMINLNYFTRKIKIKKSFINFLNKNDFKIVNSNFADEICDKSIEEINFNFKNKTENNIEKIYPEENPLLTIEIKNKFQTDILITNPKLKIKKISSKNGEISIIKINSKMSNLLLPSQKISSIHFELNFDEMYQFFDKNNSKIDKNDQKIDKNDQKNQNFEQIDDFFEILSVNFEILEGIKCCFNFKNTNFFKNLNENGQNLNKNDQNLIKIDKNGVERNFKGLNINEVRHILKRKIKPFVEKIKFDNCHPLLRCNILDFPEFLVENQILELKLELKNNDENEIKLNKINIPNIRIIDSTLKLDKFPVIIQKKNSLKISLFLYFGKIRKIVTNKTLIITTNYELLTEIDPKNTKKTAKNSQICILNKKFAKLANFQLKSVRENLFLFDFSKNTSPNENDFKNLAKIDEKISKNNEKFYKNNEKMTKNLEKMSKLTKFSNFDFIFENFDLFYESNFIINSIIPLFSDFDLHFYSKQRLEKWPINKINSEEKNFIALTKNDLKNELKLKNNQCVCLKKHCNKMRGKAENGNKNLFKICWSIKLEKLIKNNAKNAQIFEKLSKNTSNNEILANNFKNDENLTKIYKNNEKNCEKNNENNKNNAKNNENNVKNNENNAKNNENNDENNENLIKMDEKMNKKEIIISGMSLLKTSKNINFFNKNFYPFDIEIDSPLEIELSKSNFEFVEIVLKITIIPKIGILNKKEKNFLIDLKPVETSTAKIIEKEKIKEIKFPAQNKMPLATKFKLKFTAPCVFNASSAKISWEENSKFQINTLEKFCGIHLIWVK